MLEKIENLPEGIEGFRAVRKVTKDDYEAALQPLLEEARRTGHRLRFLYHLGTEFEGFTAGGALEDAKLGLAAIRSLEACAIVSDIGWIREAAHLFSFVMPCPVRTFTNAELQGAVQWLSSPPKTASDVHRLLPEVGVLVVEPQHKLRAEDFDGIAATADSWIEAHGKLNGVVIHVRKFPGWENLGSFLRHVQFVRDHHRKVRRIAVAVDSKLANVAPRLAERFVKAKFKKFRYDALDSAVAWAAHQPVH